MMESTLDVGEGSCLFPSPAYVSPRKVAPATMTNDVAFPPLRKLLAVSRRALDRTDKTG